MGLVSCILLAALAWALPAFAADEPETKTPADQPVEMRSVTAQPAQRVITLTGFTRARAVLPLVAEVAGRCLSVAAEVGQALGTEGVFCRLDETFVRLEIEANRIEQQRVVSSVAYLEKEAERYRALVKNKSEAQSRLDKLEDELTRARLNLAALKTAGATLAERLERHTIKGPPGWRVTRRKVEPGQWVNLGNEVGAVGNFQVLLVPLALTPSEFAQLRLGADKLTVRLPDLGLVVPARLERINPGFDPATRKIEVDLALDDGLPERRGGWRVEVDLHTPDPSGAVLLPAAAVEERYQEHWLRRPDGSRVRVVLMGPGPEGMLRVHSHQVKPGMTFLAPR